MDIDYHAVGEDIITANNTVDNDEAHADSNPSVERESDSSCSGSSIIIMSIMTLIRRNWRMRLNNFPDWYRWSAKQKWQHVMRAINGVMMRTG